MLLNKVVIYQSIREGNPIEFVKKGERRQKGKAEIRFQQVSKAGTLLLDHNYFCVFDDSLSHQNIRIYYCFIY